MLEKILYTLPETSLIAGVVFLLKTMIFEKKLNRTCFEIAKIFVFISAASSVLFYNKGILPQYLSVTPFSTLSYVVTCVFALVWLALSSKWFLSTKSSFGSYFCVLALSSLFCLSIIVKAVHFGILLGAFTGLALCGYLFFRFSKQSEELYHTARRYTVISLVFLLMFAFSVFLLGKNHQLFFEAASYLTEVSPLLKMFIVMGILCTLFFFLSVAPFHFWLSDASSPLVLPVATYFNLVCPMALWSLMFKLHHIVFTPLADHLKSVYFAFGVLSVVFAAIGANAGRFLRKIFTSISLYQTGVVLLVLSTFKDGLINISFIYIELYLFVLLGVYICFYAFKINGEYPLNLNLLKGASSARPYITAAFVLMTVALMGLPPLSYFMMQFVLLGEVAKFPLIVYISLFGLLALLPVYLKMIETVSFLKREQNFDRVDFGVYIYLLLHVLLLLVFAVRPQILLMQTDILLNIG